MTTRLLTLCNSYVPAELREICLMCVKEMLMLWPTDMLTLLVPLLHRSHNSSTETSENMTLGKFANFNIIAIFAIFLINYNTFSIMWHYAIAIKLQYLQYYCNI